jgi:hypothetical protein
MVKWNQQKYAKKSSYAKWCFLFQWGIYYLGLVGGGRASSAEVDESLVSVYGME